MQYYIGMMSGTSLDGIDAVLACFNNNKWSVITHADTALSGGLVDKLYRLNYPSNDWKDGEIHTAQLAEYELTHCYSKLYHSLIKKAEINPQKIMAIGAHGQTIRHEPNTDTPYTIQLLNGALLSELTQQSVICDFRRRDIAAGGQGAPLAPLFHSQLFALPKPFAVVNIGGIANISLIENEENIRGFDCGPGNCLLDEWIKRQQNKPFDNNGEWARQGQIQPQLLDQLLNDEYFKLPMPKSTGRDYFHLQWLSQYLSDAISSVDVMRTLVRLTAQAIVETVPEKMTQLLIVGGGAKNTLLVADIQQLLTERQALLNSTQRMTVLTADVLGIDVQQVEALGFALLAKETINKQKVDTRKITGASHPIILGAMYHKS